MNDSFRPSVDAESYLGKGVYFYADNENAATNWAKHRCDEKGWAVLAAAVDSGTCLNLTDNGHCKMVHQMVRELKDQGVEDVTEALAINSLVALYRKKGGKIDTIRAVLYPTHPAPLAPGGHFSMGNFLIICVVETSMISNVRLVKSGLKS